jgi:hypothetical protein
VPVPTARHSPTSPGTGRREFWSLELEVTPHTLIPRPETERLVELALERLAPGARGPVADLGTGSGAIALALASERPGLSLLATDRDPGTLCVARANAMRHNLANVTFAVADWCAPLASRQFSALVSNPPYVAPGDPHLEQGDLRFEPRTRRWSPAMPVLPTCAPSPPGHGAAWRRVATCCSNTATTSPGRSSNCSSRPATWTSPTIAITPACRGSPRRARPEPASLAAPVLHR